MAKFYDHPNADTPRLADYNGDGRDDLLFHDRTTGFVKVHYADSSGLFSATVGAQSSVSFCTGHTERLFIGNFSSGSRADLLCHNMANGTKKIDYASHNILPPLFGGSDWTGGGGWCALEEQRLIVGDFNGDGFDDLLCHNTSNGNREIDFHSGNTSSPFSWHDVTWGAWCNGPMLQLYGGRFDNDGTTDLLCHNHVNGDTSIDYAWNGFGGTDWTRGAPWCDEANPGTPLDGTENLLIADLQGDGLDDLICQDFDDGGKTLDYNQNGQFAGTDWGAGFGWCGGGDHRLYTGDVNGDGWEDLVCRSPRGGHTYVDHAHNQLAGSETAAVIFSGGAQYTTH